MVFDQKMVHRFLHVVTELLSQTKIMNLQVLFMVAWTWSWRGTDCISCNTCAIAVRGELN